MAFLFSSPWQSKKPQKRLDSLDKLPPDQAAAILAELALKDPEETVRSAAIQRIHTPGALAPLLSKAVSQNSPAQQLIRRQLISVLDSGHGAAQGLALESRQRWLRNCTDHNALAHLACYAYEPELRKTALLQANQQKLWQHCLLNDPLLANRELAVERIENTTALQQLIERLRKTDKHITRQLQHHLEQTLLDQGDADTVKALKLRCCEQLEKLIATQSEPEALKQNDAEWAQLNSTDPALAFPALAERHARARRIFLRLHEPQAAPATEAATAAPEETTSAITEPSETAEDPALSTAKRIAGKAANWLKDTQAPRSKHLLALRKEWQTVKEQLKDQTLANSINEQVSQLSQRLQAQNEQWQKDLAAVVLQLPKIATLLEEGQLQVARELYKQSEATLQRLKTIQSPDEWRNAFDELKALRPALQTLGETQHWSNNLKRRELCERVESLIGKDIEPEALAEQIKKAQADWKALDAAENAKSNDKDGHTRSASPAIWKQFQGLCRKAWEPCAEHFEAQRQQRAVKIQHIEKVMQDLQAFGDKAKRFDQNVIDTAVRSGHQMLGDLRRMPIKETRKLEKNLRAALAPFQQANEQQQKQAAYAKRQLIEKAAQINPSDDLGEAIKQIKQLQADWKNTGKTDFKSDRTLWTEFRQHADRIFGSLDTQRQQENQTRKEASTQLAQLVKNINALAEQAGDINLHELQKLTSQAAALESEADNRKLSQQLAEATETVKNAAKAQADSARLQRLAALADKAAERMSDSVDDKQQAAALDRVITMEILAGQSSPNEDKARRLELQVAQLSANLGGGNKQQNVMDLAEAWYQEASTTAQQWPALHKRVQTLLNT